MSYTPPSPGRGDRRLNTTDYQHPQETNLLDVARALQYRYLTGEPELRVNLGPNAFVISGNVLIPGIVQVFSDPDNPIHNHITEVGTGGNLQVPWLPIAGNVTVDSGNIIVTQGTTPWVITGNANVAVTSMPEIEIKNDANNPIPISANTTVNSASNPIHITGAVTTAGGSAQGKLWTMQIAQGLIPGHSVESISGYNPATSAGDAVWSAATSYPWSSLVTAQTLYLKSSTNNATDRSMPILVDGLDANYANQTEVVTLDAADSRTAVATTKQFLRIHSIMCNGTDTNVGDITTHVTSGTGTVVSKLSAGRGRAQAGVFTVPAGYTGYLFKGDASSTAATVVNFMGRYFGKAFMILHVAIVDNSTYIYDFPFPMTLPEKTDMYTVIEAGSGKTAVNYEILLVANS